MSLCVLCDSVFPSRFWNDPDQVKTQIQFGVIRATELIGARASELVRRSEECLRSC